MARGAIAKEKIKEKILNVFEGSFVYNSGKEIRIPIDEEGTLVQIKVALTCAKDVVSAEGDIERLAAAPLEEDAFMNFPEPHKPVEPTEEEKKTVQSLLEALGLN